MPIAKPENDLNVLFMSYEAPAIEDEIQTHRNENASS